MTKIDFIFTKEMAKLLKKVREKSNLSQVEIAKRIGFAPKSGKIYISLLENGKIKNPSLGFVLRYLSTCSYPWSEFFKELDIIDFKMRHEKMISQLPPQAAQRKIQRDAMRYEIGVEFPSKEKEEIDFTRLKKRIKDKVEVLLSKEENTLTPILSPNRVPRPEEGRVDHQGRGKNIGIADYQKFALEVFDFLAALNKPGRKMVVEKYQRAGLQRHLLFKITKIIYSVIGAELKRIEAKKPLPTEKQEKMAIGFTKYRIRIKRIEAEVHKVLCELGVPTSWFALYKDFSRQCYRTLKQYYGREPEKLKAKLSEHVREWQTRGLQENVLLRVKEKTQSTYIGRN